MHLIRKNGNFWFNWNMNTKQFPLQVIHSFEDLQLKPTGSLGSPQQPDPYLRSEIEKIAITKTIDHFRNLGYSVFSVEKDNMGWDLEATKTDTTLKLEVKGLSQISILIELTPNEYQKLKENKNSYRLCVVTDALGTSPKLTIFSFCPSTNTWKDKNGNRLTLIEKTSARMFL